ncbi:MAG: hypothetical protein PHW11_09635 [Anaerolineaceae bacterium]|jgi:hypothetical protein|nr:hypothetical protein [Anaerolineaceae bacterium]MDD4043256.1 hypothetical protein [Anaerolineaceae bacterium]
MKFKLASVVLVLALLLGGVFTSAQAGAYTTQFTTSVTYQNVGTGPATINLVFYGEADPNGIPITLPELAPLAGTSIYVGSVGDIANGFKGSAVMSSNQPLVSTLVQVPKAGNPSGVKVRPMSNGFTSGSDYVLVPTVLKGTFDANTIVSVQNVDTVPADFELTFVPISGAPITVNTVAIPPHATKYYDLGVMSAIPAGFNGSLQVNSTGPVVASALELKIVAAGAYAFEAASDFSNTIYMPSALCKFNGVQTSSYAVQNTTTGDVDVTVAYAGGGTAGPVTLAAGAKGSFNACDVNDDGYIGSAVITATGDVVAMGKVFGGGLSTAFLGFNNGAAKVALPYVRWTTDHYFDGTRQRSYIAIQNVGAALGAGTVTVKYYDKAGVLVGTDTLGAIPAGGKVNSNAGVVGAAEFGYYTDGTFGGSAVIEGPAGSQLAVIVRVQSRAGATTVAEDYSGIVIQ